MRHFLLLVCILVGGQLLSQPWIHYVSKKKSSKKITFYNVQDAFELYWKQKKKEKGKGYKQFKRWEAFMVPRVYPNGVFPSGIIWNELQNSLKNKTTSLTNSNWEQIGPLVVPFDNENEPSGIGRVNCIAFHPSNANIIYLGTPAGGLWKSDDAGNSWKTTTDKLGTLGVSDIAIHPINPDKLYIATGDGDAGDTYSVGILFSEDGGEKWSLSGLSFELIDNIVIQRLLLNPSDPEILLAASSNGIYRTSNGGQSWVNVQSGYFKDLEFNPSDPSIIYAARYGSNNARFYKSVDGGASFNEITTGVKLNETFRLALAVGGSTAADVIYALYSEQEHDGFHSLWKSSDAGDNWEKVYDSKIGINLLGWTSDGSDIGGQGWYDLSLAVSPTDENEVYVGGVNIWKSTNAGIDWTLVGDWSGELASYVHADHHTLIYSPTNVLFNGNDGGIYKSNDSGASWIDISTGLNILQIDRVGTSQANSSIVITGNQDNGTMKFDAIGNSWKQIYAGDGAECIVDKENNNILYISHVNGDFQRSYDGGNTFVSIKPDGVGEGAWHTPLVIHPERSNILFAGFKDVWKSSDRGNSWEKISNNLSSGKLITQLAVAPSNTNYIYATTGTMHWVTKDGGKSWNAINSPDLPNLYITSLAVADNNPDHIWVSFSGFSEGEKVYFSNNGGGNWVNLSEGLPNVPTNNIIREQFSSDVLYLATDIGVYYRDGSKSEWKLFGNQLPNVVVSELELQYSNALLRAGTRGRGLWQIPIILTNENAVYIIKAEVVANGTKIEITFNKAMKNPFGNEKEFIISNGIIAMPVSIGLKEGTTNVYVITLAEKIGQDDIVTISYTGENIASTDGVKLPPFVNRGIENNITITDIEKSDKIKVYPNPNNGQFDIEYQSSSSSSELKVQIINFHGQVIFSKSFQHEKNELVKQSLNIPKNVKGVYLLLIENGRQHCKQTIVIE